MIQEAYCSFEIAKVLKEKGFDEPTYLFYEVSEYPPATTKDKLEKITGKNVETVETHSMLGLEDEPFFNSIQGKNKNQFACPTHQMAMAWLRGEGICIEPYAPAFRYGFTISKLPTGSQICNEFDCYPNDEFETYEEAVEAALKYVLKHLL